MYSPELIMITLLLLVPVAAAVLLALFKPDIIRNIIVTVSAVVLIGTSVALAASAWSNGITVVHAAIPWLWTALFLVEFAVAVIILCLAVKYKKPLAIILAVVQAVLLLILEFSGIVHPQAEIVLTLSNLSLIMVLIIGIIGSLICVYALGYMKDYAAHSHDVPDRRRYFFAILFLFLTQNSNHDCFFFTNNILNIKKKKKKKQFCNIFM